MPFLSSLNFSKYLRFSNLIWIICWLLYFTIKSWWLSCRLCFIVIYWVIRMLEILSIIIVSMLSSSGNPFACPSQNGNIILLCCSLWPLLLPTLRFYYRHNVFKLSSLSSNIVFFYYSEEEKKGKMAKWGDEPLLFVTNAILNKD